MTAIVIATTLMVPQAAPAGAGDGLLGGLLGLVGQVVRGLPATVGGVVRFGVSPLDEFAPQPATPLQPGQVTDLIGARTLRQRGLDGTGVDVALVDTGVAPVPALDDEGAVIVGPDLSFDPQGSDMPLGIDAYGHGTHMASLIAGRGTSQAQGIAPGARILDMKVGASNGAVDVSQVIAAINWVDQHRNDPGMDVRVLNLSYGTDGVQPYQVDPLAHAVETAWRHGIVVVVAAGNSGGALTNPAIDPYVLTVGAADMGGSAASPADDKTAAFSSVGTAQRGVDLLAPGVSLVGARVPGSAADTEHPEARVGTTQFRGSGTSQAAAVVSGAVALLLQDRPELTPDQVKEILVDSGRVLLRSARSTQGSGLLHLATASADRPIDAPQAHPRSTGLGSLDAARGTARVSDGQAELAGEIDIMSTPWNPQAWAAGTDAATTWAGGTWNGTTWTGDGWVDGDLGVYTGRTWRGQAFSGRTWRGETWTGRTWRGEAWSGRTWRADIWTGRTWRSV
ncbi:MAG TPA: S8 family serine peptidase [Iamia sp.]